MKAFIVLLSLVTIAASVKVQSKLAPQVQQSTDLFKYSPDDEYSLPADIDDDDNKPPTSYQGDNKLARVSQLQNLNQGKGKFKVSLKTENGIEVEQAGKLKDEKTFVISGSYKYTGADGKRYKVRYTADEFGYHPITELDLDIPEVVATTRSPTSFDVNIGKLDTDKNFQFLKRPIGGVAGASGSKSVDYNDNTGYSGGSLAGSKAAGAGGFGGSASATRFGAGSGNGAFGTGNGAFGAGNGAFGAGNGAFGAGKGAFGAGKGAFGAGGVGSGAGKFSSGSQGQGALHGSDQSILAGYPGLFGSDNGVLDSDLNGLGANGVTGNGAFALGNGGVDSYGNSLGPDDGAGAGAGGKKAFAAGGTKFAGGSAFGSGSGSKSGFGGAGQFGSGSKSGFGGAGKFGSGSKTGFAGAGEFGSFGPSSGSVADSDIGDVFKTIEQHDGTGYKYPSPKPDTTYLPPRRY